MVSINSDSKIVKYKLESVSTNLRGNVWKNVPQQRLLTFFSFIFITQECKLHGTTQGWTSSSKISEASSHVSYNSEMK